MGGTNTGNIGGAAAPLPLPLTKKVDYFSMFEQNEIIVIRSVKGKRGGKEEE